METSDPKTAAGSINSLSANRKDKSDNISSNWHRVKGTMENIIVYNIGMEDSTDNDYHDIEILLRGIV